jgi:alanyl-tRNA synthetase
MTLGDLPSELVLDTAGRFGLAIAPGLVVDVMAAEERRFAELLTRGRWLVRRLYPAGDLREDDYAYLHDTHGLPRELVTSLLSELPR